MLVTFSLGKKIFLDQATALGLYISVFTPFFRHKSTNYTSCTSCPGKTLNSSTSGNRVRIIAVSLLLRFSSLPIYWPESLAGGS